MSMSSVPLRSSSCGEGRGIGAGGGWRVAGGRRRTRYVGVLPLIGSESACRAPEPGAAVRRRRVGQRRLRKVLPIGRRSSAARGKCHGGLGLNQAGGRGG